MRAMHSSARTPRASLRRPIVALAIVVAVPWLAVSPAAMGGTATMGSASATQAVLVGSGQTGQSTPPGSKASASATLEQCATATIPQTERAATFAGEMTAIPGTVRMEMRIDLEERVPGEPLYRTVNAPGLGVWHSSAAGVKIFTHIQQVTNLSAPALYRGALRFRWVNARSRPIKTEELHTPRCEQPAVPSTTGTTVPTGAISSSASTATGSVADTTTPAST
ncbi:MAG: hypothetical protein ABSB69_13570 [Solirubrobacteraceae bacterium]